MEREDKSGPSTPGVARKWLCQCENGHERWLRPREFARGTPVRCQVCKLPETEALAQAAEDKKARGAALRAEREKFVKAIEDGEIMHPARWKEIVDGAAARGKCLDLTEAEALKLFKDQSGLCALSGLPIEMKTSNKQTGSASLDRKDSYRGYTLGNVQWVHPTINLMKYNLPTEEFVSLCRMVAERAAVAAE